MSESVQESVLTEDAPAVLEVSEVQVFPVHKKTSKIRAMARVLLQNQLMLTGLRVIEGSNGEFVAYPNDPGHKGEDYRQIFYPITRELREEVEKQVLEVYQQSLHAA